MSDVTIYKNSTNKPFDTFLADLTKEIEAEGFAIYHRDKSDLVNFYRCEGFDLPDHFKHIMLQICKPASSSKSIYANPERSVFVQKFIFVYTKGEQTEIRFLGYSDQIIGDLLGHNEFEKGPSDDDFATRMKGTYATMEKIVQAAV
ncbi:MAG: hypothetical protein KAU22_03635 [Desulfuromonadales bacterium]|nr:hypothetical protein [Desulfuromonadales bacterium]